MKKLTIVWGIIVLSLFSVLATYGIMFTNKRKEYKEAETKLSEAGKKYGELDFVYNKIDSNGLIVSLADLQKEGLIGEFKIKDEDCSGYVIIKKDEYVYKYDGYVKCKNYQTKGYSE